VLAEPLLVVGQIAAVLEGLEVPYVVGGSLASSVYGIPRATQDVDLVADLKHDQVEAFAGALAQQFYVDADMATDAINRRASFNVIHLATMFKADIFVPGHDPWTREELRRARTEEFDVSGDRMTLRFASPEDILLHKLLWYKLGNEISDRQWGDVIGILKIQGEELDTAYLDTWADILEITPLLVRARCEVSRE
jgi:hypothetical protein